MQKGSTSKVCKQLRRAVVSSYFVNLYVIIVPKYARVKKSNG